MSTFLLVLGPLAAYGLFLGARVLARRPPDRRSLNIELSLLLALYFLVTASLGVFWVANQELPPFELHYLFGYATTALVLAHLSFNLSAVVRHFRHTRGQPARNTFASTTLRGMGLLALAVGIFLFGMRAGRTALVVERGTHNGLASELAVERYHEFSSHSRAGVVVRAPSVTWELPVPRTIDRSGLHSTPLPAPDLARETANRTGSMSIDDLSIILWAGAGKTDTRGGLELRASASSGALFPTELYVWLYAVEGISPGVYAYQPDEHALATITHSAPPRSEVGAHPDTEVIVVATSVFRRSGQKYRDRAYRYAAADAGHVVGNVLEAAFALNVGAQPLGRFDDGSALRLVHADAREEGTIAMLELGHRLRPRPAPPPLRAAELPEEEMLTLGATSLAHWATALERPPPTETEAALFVLPAPARPDHPRLERIARRRSIRDFSDQPVSLQQVSNVLAGSVLEPSLSHAVVPYLVASRVNGLAEGIYRYDTERHALHLVRPGLVDKDAGRAALDQEVIASAPVAVVLAFDRGILRAEGPRGYRHAFVEAGIVGSRLYLATQAAGLGGCSVGAFYDNEASQLIGASDKEVWPAHFFGFGMPQN